MGGSVWGCFQSLQLYLPNPLPLAKATWLNRIHLIQKIDGHDLNYEQMLLMRLSEPTVFVSNAHRLGTLPRDAAASLTATTWRVRSSIRLEDVSIATARRTGGMDFETLLAFKERFQVIEAKAVSAGQTLRRFAG